MLISLLLLPALAFSAAPLLERGASYSVKAERKEAAIAPKVLKEKRVETRIELQTYRGEEKEPNVRSDTNQLLRVKGLEPEGRMEVEFEKFDITSRIPLPGMSKPFETRQDLGIHLLGKPFILRWQAGEVVGVEGLEKVRARLSAEVKDPISKHTLMQIISEDMIKKSLGNIAINEPCLTDLPKKKPDEKWKVTKTEGANKLNYDCTFEGWAEAKGKKVMVVSYAIPSQKSVNSGPAGTQTNQVSGKGRVILEPESGEALLSSTNTFVMEEARKGAAPGRTEIASWNLHYPN